MLLISAGHRAEEECFRYRSSLKSRYEICEKFRDLHSRRLPLCQRSGNCIITLIKSIVSLRHRFDGIGPEGEGRTSPVFNFTNIVFTLQK